MSTATQQHAPNGFHTSPAIDPSTAQSQANADAQRSSANAAQSPPQPAKDADVQNSNTQNTQQQNQQQQAQTPPTAPPPASQVPINPWAHHFQQLRSAIPPVAPSRPGRKRKVPEDAPTNPQGPPPPPPQPQPLAQVQQQTQQVTSGALAAPPAGTVYSGIPYPAFPPPGDYTTAGMPHMQQGTPGQETQPTTPDSSNPQRQLSTSKRAEQNRKAQRAFRERRDQHVRALESRSQLLDAALASADEANRRWEECRALVDQLRIENTALRTALQSAQQALANAGVSLTSTAGKNEGDGDQSKQQNPPTAADTKEGS